MTSCKRCAVFTQRKLLLTLGFIVEEKGSTFAGKDWRKPTSNGVSEKNAKERIPQIRGVLEAIPVRKVGFTANSSLTPRLCGVIPERRFLSGGVPVVTGRKILKEGQGFQFKKAN
ncbi:hypothetical protein MUK42_36946 [Musa troglodytarum]|uniref:Uncharacterized protein n=1 Tax=Musa troglodytarum TaxID=320322 RepID=A0A9E7J992_9LILI|nr:hypothetical protein MUK42_36946 [Musa troglodytarum]